MIPPKKPAMQKTAKPKAPALNEYLEQKKDMAATAKLQAEGKPTGLTFVSGPSKRSTRAPAKAKTGRY